MLRYTILLICAILSGTIVCAQVSSSTTGTTARDSALVDSRTINHIYTDLLANVEYADSLYAENVLLKRGALNCGKSISKCAVMDSTSQVIIKKQKGIIANQDRKLKGFKWLSVGGLGGIIALALQAFFGG